PRLGVNLEGHGGAVLALAFGGGDGKLLVSGSADTTARFWPLQDVRPFERPGTVGHLSQVTAAAFAPGGALLVTSGRDGAIRIWNFEGPAPRERLVLKDNPDMTGLSVAADSQSFVATSLVGQGLAKQFRLADGQQVKSVVPQLKGQGLCMAVAPDGQQ